MHSSDLDLPIDCDDEYWSHPDPAQAFKQPAGIPSTVSAFIVMVKLHRLMRIALRLLVSTGRPRRAISVELSQYRVNTDISHKLAGLTGPEWDHQTMSMLDSQLNKSIDTLPVHRQSLICNYSARTLTSAPVQWDPNHPDPLFKHQSALIHITHYHLRMLTHRRFVLALSSTGVSMLDLPSRSIATNAARSCIRQMRSIEDAGVFIDPTVPVSDGSSFWDSELTFVVGRWSYWYLR